MEWPRWEQEFLKQKPHSYYEHTRTCTAMSQRLNEGNARRNRTSVTSCKTLLYDDLITQDVLIRYAISNENEEACTLGVVWVM